MKYKILSFLIYILIIPKIMGQSDIEMLIDKISKESFVFENVNYANISVKIDKNANTLAKKDKKIITSKLIQVMDQDDKFLISHFILTKIWCPKKLSNIKIEYIYDVDDIDDAEIFMEVYTINKLIFIKDLKDDKYIVSSSSLNKIKVHWLDLQSK